MSSWTIQIKLRKPVHRMMAALIGGAVVKLLTIVLYPIVFYWMGWPPQLPEWLFVLIYAGISSFVPLHVMVWIGPLAVATAANAADIIAPRTT